MYRRPKDCIDSYLRLDSYSYVYRRPKDCIDSYLRLGSYSNRIDALRLVESTRGYKTNSIDWGVRV